MLQSAIAMSQPAQVNSRAMGLSAGTNNRPAPAAQDTKKTEAETNTNFANELNSAADAKHASDLNSSSELSHSSTLNSPKLNSADLAQTQFAQTDATLTDQLTAELTGDATAEQLPGTGPDTNPQAEQDTAAAEEWILNMLGQQTAQLQARDLAQTNAGETQDLAVTLPATVNTAEKTLESKQLADQQALLTQNQSAAQKQAQSTLVVTDTGESGKDQAVTNNPVIDSASDTTRRTPHHFPPATELAFNQLADQSVDQTKNALASAIADRLSGVGAAQSHDGTATTATILTNQTLTDAVPERTLKLHGTEAKWGEQMLHTLRENVGLQLQHRQQSATIRLDPPELGSMEIFLSHESGRLNVQISASQGDVARLLQQTSDRLRQELVNQQFVQVNVQVSSDNQGGQRHSRQQIAQWSEEQITQNHQGAESSSSGKSTTHNDILVTV